MTIYARLTYPLIAVFVFCGLVLAEDGILPIHVSNAEDDPIAGVVLSNKGDGTKSDPTNSAGVTRLALSGASKPGDWVHLQVLKGQAPKETEDNESWILISPWDGRVQVPLFDNKADRFVSIVVARKFDKRLLANPIALRAMAATANSELSPKTPAEISEEQRRAVLVEVAQGYGLEADDIDKAIRAWGEKSKDAYEIGLAALYAKNYPLATEQLSKSLGIREAELEKMKTILEKKKAEVADSAFFLGQSFYAEGKYQESANAYRKAAAQRPDDVIIMNNLALSLTEAGNYAEAEAVLKQALATHDKTPGNDQSRLTSLTNQALIYFNQGKVAEVESLLSQVLAIREKRLGLDHPEVALSLNNLAAFYNRQGKYAKAEPLYKRALAIWEKALGPDHPNVSIALENYAALLRKMNRANEAAQMENRAKAIRARHEQTNPK